MEGVISLEMEHGRLNHLEGMSQDFCRFYMIVIMARNIGTMTVKDLFVKAEVFFTRLRKYSVDIERILAKSHFYQLEIEPNKLLADCGLFPDGRENNVRKKSW